MWSTDGIYLLTELLNRSEEGIFSEANNAVPPQLLAQASRTNRTSAVTSTAMDLPLFYPSSPSHHQPGKHYGLPRETYHPLPTQRNKDSFRHPAGFTPIQPSFGGFPPISNTRENVKLEINWAAKVGRAHRSFYDFLLAWFCMPMLSFRLVNDHCILLNQCLRQCLRDQIYRMFGVLILKLITSTWCLRKLSDD